MLQFFPGLNLLFYYILNVFLKAVRILMLINECVVDINAQVVGGSNFHVGKRVGCV